MPDLMYVPRARINETPERAPCHSGHSFLILTHSVLAALGALPSLCVVLSGSSSLDIFTMTFGFAAANRKGGLGVNHDRGRLTVGGLGLM